MFRRIREIDFKYTKQRHGTAPVLIRRVPCLCVFSLLQLFTGFSCISATCLRERFFFQTPKEPSEKYRKAAERFHLRFFLHFSNCPRKMHTHAQPRMNSIVSPCRIYAAKKQTAASTESPIVHLLISIFFFILCFLSAAGRTRCSYSHTSQTFFHPNPFSVPHKPGTARSAAISLH